MQQSVNVEAAKTNPSEFFHSPHEVLVHPQLSRKNKIDILRQWEVDARLMSVAEEESMTKGEKGESGHLGAVVSALIALDDENKRPDHDTGSTPAKHGG
jgi:hypothetical protein